MKNPTPETRRFPSPTGNDSMAGNANGWFKRAAEGAASANQRHDRWVMTGKQVAELLLKDGRYMCVHTVNREAYYIEKAAATTIYFKHLFGFWCERHHVIND